MSEISELPQRRFTVDDVLRMVEVGILAEDERVELLDGRLVEMGPQGPRHVYAKDRVAAWLRSVVPDGHVREQSPVVAADDQMPEPDVAWVGGDSRDFRDRHPRGDEVRLAVEISDSTRKVDRAKAAIYARAGVPAYWLVDVVAGRVEVRSEPTTDGEYRLVRLLQDDDVLDLPGTPRSVTVTGLLA